MYTYDTHHLTPSSASPGVPKVRITNEPRGFKDDSAKVAWAAKILSDYTRQKRLEHNEIESEEIGDSTQGEEETEGEEGDTFYQMCYLPIVLACILIGALMIGVVIYFVEDENAVVTTDNPVNNE